MKVAIVGYAGFNELDIFAPLYIINRLRAASGKDEVAREDEVVPEEVRPNAAKVPVDEERLEVTTAMMTKKKPSARPPHDHQKALCVRIIQYYEYINHIALYREIWG